MKGAHHSSSLNKKRPKDTKRARNGLQVCRKDVPGTHDQSEFISQCESSHSTAASSFSHTNVHECEFQSRKNTRHVSCCVAHRSQTCTQAYGTRTRPRYLSRRSSAQGTTLTMCTASAALHLRRAVDLLPLSDTPAPYPLTPAFASRDKWADVPADGTTKLLPQGRHAAT